MNYLVQDLLKIHTPHHTQIQRLIRDYFARCGYDSRTEKEVWRNRRRWSDVFAQKGGYTVGIEVDGCLIRVNSIEKINALKPSGGFWLCLFSLLTKYRLWLNRTMVVI